MSKIHTIECICGVVHNDGQHALADIALSRRFGLDDLQQFPLTSTILSFCDLTFLAWWQTLKHKFYNDKHELYNYFSHTNLEIFLIIWEY